MKEVNRQISAVSRPPRDSSFELLRIISMFSIVICHFATHGEFQFDTQTISVPRLWWYFIEMGGNFGVNIFVLISGYFLIDVKDEAFNFRRILKFWGQVFFYSVLIPVVFSAAGVVKLTIKEWIKAGLPLLFRQWWFASAYFVLYLIHPFLNIFLHSLSKKTFQSFVATLLIIWCIVPTFTFSTFECNDLLWFITLYSVAAYIRLFDLNPSFNTKHYLVYWLLFSSLRYFSSLIFILIGTKVSAALRYSLTFYGKQSLLTFLSACSLFMVFKYVKIQNNRWINLIASATFGVYLLHDNNIVRPILWSRVFHNATYRGTGWLIPYSIVSACVVFFICTAIDLLRKATVERAFMRFVNKNAESILRPFCTLLSKLNTLFFGKKN